MRAPAHCWADRTVNRGSCYCGKEGVMKTVRIFRLVLACALVVFSVDAVAQAAPRRGLSWWRASAHSSLPVPLSPVMNTVARLGAALSMMR